MLPEPEWAGEQKQFVLGRNVKQQLKQHKLVWIHTRRSHSLQMPKGQLHPLHHSHSCSQMHLYGL